MPRPRRSSKPSRTRTPIHSRLTGMQATVDRICYALQHNEPIAIYGDYDVDGVTATALLVQASRRFGANVRGYIPNRFDEGYGLNKDALDTLKADGVKLVITVDCGIRSPTKRSTRRPSGWTSSSATITTPTAQTCLPPLRSSTRNSTAIFTRIKTSPGLGSPTRSRKRCSRSSSRSTDSRQMTCLTWWRWEPWRTSRRSLAKTGCSSARGCASSARRSGRDSSLWQASRI